MRLTILFLFTAACVPLDKPSAEAAWTLEGLRLELDDFTRVAVVGEALAGERADPVEIVATYEAYSGDEVTVVSASITLAPIGYAAGGEFVIASDDVRYWPGADGYDDVCADLSADDSNIYEPYDLGCIGDTP